MRFVKLGSACYMSTIQEFDSIRLCELSLSDCVGYDVFDYSLIKIIMHVGFTNTYTELHVPSWCSVGASFVHISVIFGSQSLLLIFDQA